MPNLSLKIDNSCPIVVTDVGDYSDVLSLGTISLNGLGLNPNSNSTLNSVLVATTELLTESVTFTADSSGNVVEPDCVYKRILAALDTTGAFFYEISNSTGNPDDTYISILTFDKTFFAKPYSITVQGPFVPIDFNSIMSTPSRCLVFRNLSVFSEDGKQIDIGQREQIDKIVLHQEYYQVGQIITADFCGFDQVVHTVETGFTNKECVAIQLAAKITKYIDLVETSYTGNGTIEVSSKEKGISFCLHVGPDSSLITSTTIQEAHSSLPIFNDINNEVIIHPSASGNLKVKLTVLTNDCSDTCTDCIYDTICERTLNYCDTLCKLNCAIVNGVLKEDSGCGCLGNNSKRVEEMRNILSAMTYMIESGYKEDELGKLSDYALNFIEEADCGCGCGDSSHSSTGNKVNESCKPKCCFCIK